MIAARRAGAAGPPAATIDALRAEIDRLAEEQAVLLRVSRAATWSLSSGDVLNEVARASLDLAGAECCAVELWRPESDEMEVVAEVTSATWPVTPEPGWRYPLEGWPAVREALMGTQPVSIVGGAPELVHPAHGRLLDGEVRSALMVPMLAGRECVGLLCLYARAEEAFTERGLRLTMEVAAQAALAAQNARLLEGARRRAEEQAALLRVSRVVNSGNDLTAVLPQVARECLGASGVEGATIEVWDPVAEETRVVARAFVPGWPTHQVVGARFGVSDRPAVRSVLVTGEPVILSGDPSILSEGEREALAVDGIQSVLIVPVLFGTDCRGAVTLLSRRTGAFPLNALWFAQDLAAQVAQAMERARLNVALREQAETDGLTGLLNHRAILETLDRELSLARRRGGSMAVLLVDLDDFKLFNDTHGHLVGDRVLRDVATLLRSCVRDVDAVGRYGGDEFLLVLPDADAAGATRAAERILARAAVRTVPVGELRLPLRLSVGPAIYPQDGDTRQQLIDRADEAMYAAKGAGGGKVGIPSHDTSTLQLTAFGSLAGLIDAVDRKDRYTKAHSEQVARLANAFGELLELPAADREALDIAARLHDVGKIAVPDAVLRKPGRLAPAEVAALRQHVTYGELLLQGVPHAPVVRAAVASHHERWDGSGYPRGLAGAAIPRLGRILALVDAWVAMTTDRPYRKGMTPVRAAAELRAGAGSQFDPTLIQPFLAVLVRLGILTEVPPSPEDQATAPAKIVDLTERAFDPARGRSATDRLRPFRG